MGKYVSMNPCNPYSTFNIRLYDTPTDTCSPGFSDAFSCRTGQGFLNSPAVDRFLRQISAARAWLNARGGTQSQD